MLRNFSCHADIVWLIRHSLASLKKRPVSRLRVALYQPDIAGNTGAILRLGACLGIGVDIVEPAGFDMSDRALKRAGMDYLEIAALMRHLDFAAFETWRRGEERRLVLFTTGAGNSYCSAIAPTIKISARPDTIRHLAAQIDFDASGVFAGREDLDAAADRLFALLLDVSSGTRTWGEVVGEAAESVIRVGGSL